MIIIPTIRGVHWTDEYLNLPDFFNVKIFAGSNNLDLEATIKERKRLKQIWLETNYLAETTFASQKQKAATKAFTYDVGDNSVDTEYNPEFEQTNYVIALEISDLGEEIYTYYFIEDITYPSQGAMKVYLKADHLFNNIEYLDLMLTDELVAERGHLDRFRYLDSQSNAKVFNWAENSQLAKKEPFLESFIPQINHVSDVIGAQVEYQPELQDQGAILLFINSSYFKLDSANLNIDETNKEKLVPYTNFVSDTRLFIEGDQNYGFGLKLTEGSDDKKVANLPYTILVLPFNTEIKDNQGNNVLNHSHYLKLINHPNLKNAIMNATVVPYFKYNALADKELWNSGELVDELKEIDTNVTYGLYAHNASQFISQLKLDQTNKDLIKDIFVPKVNIGGNYDLTLEPKIYQYPLTQIEIQHISSKGYLIAPEKLLWQDAWNYDDKTQKLDSNLNIEQNSSMVPEVSKIFANFTNGYYLSQKENGIGLLVKNNYSLPFSNPSWYNHQEFNNLFSSHTMPESQDKQDEALEVSGSSQLLKDVGNMLPNFDLANRDSRLQVGGELISDLALGAKHAEGLRLKVNVKRARQQELAKYAMIFNKYGYNINDMIDKELLFNGRYYFNYVKVNALDDYLISNYLNHEELEAIKQAFKNGIRFWHQYEYDELQGGFALLLNKSKQNLLNFESDNYEIAFKDSLNK